MRSTTTPALRERLLEAGHELRGHSDTEVLPHLYEEYGDELVHALEGMFALAIWDSRRHRLLLARDRFGEKPLFLSERGATQLRLRVARAGPGLASEPDSTLAPSMSSSCSATCPDRSALEGIRQLPAGHLLTWDHERQRIEQRRYWQPPVHGVVTNEPVEELAAEAGRLLEESIRGRLLADVPLGIFLSGGVDSSLIATLATRQAGSGIKTFTVGYDAGERDERSAARSIASLLGSDHHELTLTSDEAATRSFAARRPRPAARRPGHRPPACGRRVRPRRGDRGHRR